MRTLFLLVVGLRLLSLTGCTDASEYTDTPATEREVLMADADYTQIPFMTITGEKTSLNDYKGHALLIVNTASECGYTKQYAGLEKLYRDKKDRGFIILGFPANNFGGQEPGSDEEILNFCRTKFDVTFPMMSKIDVAGDNIHPLFKYLTEDSPHPGKIRWNFSKFLLDADGNLVARYDSKVEPDDPELVAQIDKLLPLQ